MGLARLLADLLPADDEVRALLALLLLQQARRPARLDADGDLVPMDEQDRRLWNQRQINDGINHLLVARAADRPAGPYRLQAEIAALHTTVTRAQDTDWAGIVDCYDDLLRAQNSPVVALNRAVAIGFRDGPVAGLTAVATVADDPRMSGYPLVPAVRADLLRRAGRADEAIEAYREAVDRAGTAAERRFLRRRLRELGDSG